MTKDEFLHRLKHSRDVIVRLYKSGPDVVPDNYPWQIMQPYIQVHNGEIVLITPNLNWAEYSPKYDIDSFDGTTMVFVAEEYVMEVRL